MILERMPVMAPLSLFLGLCGLGSVFGRIDRLVN